MKQAVNDVPLECSYFIKCYPKLDQHFKSIHASRVIGRLEYWFQSPLFKNGFYKFFHPCDHFLYNQGDSWIEEIGLERRAFNKVFDLIGIRYKSKAEFLNAQDRFQGKLYASYYNRKTNKTFYVRNHDFVETFLKSLFKRKNATEPAFNKCDVDMKGRDIHKYNGRSCKNLNGHSLNIDQRTTNKVSSIENKIISENLLSESNSPAIEMIQIWEEEVGQTLNKSVSLTLKTKLETSLKEKLGQNMDNWRQYCRKIASSKFLMGEVTKFKAWLTWASKPETNDEIENGNYSLGDREANPQKVENYLTKQILQHIARQPTHPAQALHQCLNDLIGLHNYYNWMKDLHIADIQPDRIIFIVKNDFIKSEIEKR
ncbi:MAG: hypothetical protein H0U27_11890, partial [Nitrosopumilus sp.]|nr:hypothetical protein [Nitrosopumilus sp.]